MTFSPEMRRALEEDARKLEALGQDSGPTFPSGLHTCDGSTCLACGHLNSSHDTLGCTVGHGCYADDDREGYDPYPCDCAKIIYPFIPEANRDR